MIMARCAASISECDCRIFEERTIFFPVTWAMPLTNDFNPESSTSITPASTSDTAAMAPAAAVIFRPMVQDDPEFMPPPSRGRPNPRSRLP